MPRTLTQGREAEALYAYVRGDSSEPVLMSDLNGVSREELRRVLEEHRGALVEIDAARSVILESMI